MPIPPEQLGPDDLPYHKAAAPSRTFLSQVDEAVAYLVRDFVPALMDGIDRNFPAASAALPAAKWRQIGLAALGLVGIDWLIGLGPETANSLVWVGVLGLAGYTGWSITNQARLTRQDQTARRFGEHTAGLSAVAVEERIAALAALDQLAYDHPRYRRPLVHLLTAWLDGRAALGHAAASGADSSVARQMLLEFHQMLLAETDTEREPLLEDLLLEHHRAAQPLAVNDRPTAEGLPTEETGAAAAAAAPAEDSADPAALELVPAAELQSAGQEMPEEPDAAELDNRTTATNLSAASD